MLVHGCSRARRPLHFDCAHAVVPVQGSCVCRGLVDESAIVNLSLLEVVISSKGRRCRRVGTDALALLGLECPGPEGLDVHPLSWTGAPLFAVACVVRVAWRKRVGRVSALLGAASVYVGSSKGPRRLLSLSLCSFTLKHSKGNSFAHTPITQVLRRASEAAIRTSSSNFSRPTSLARYSTSLLSSRTSQSPR